MIIKNKKNGTNILAYKNHGVVTRVSIGSGEQVNIPHLSDFSQIVNKGDFEVSRGWFEVVKENNSEVVVEEKKSKTKTETSLEKAKKEVIEYTSEKKKKD